MHPDDPSGHVIDLGVDFANASAPSMVMKDESDEFDEQPMIHTNNTKKINEPISQSYSQVFTEDYFLSHISQSSFLNSQSEIINTKLKDIDNAPSLAPPSSANLSQSTRPDRLYGCSACAFETTNSTNIHRHVELHSGEDGGGFQCSQCFFLSKWRASIRKHMISTHGSSLASLTNVLEPLILIKSDDATIIVKKWLSTYTHPSLVHNRSFPLFFQFMKMVINMKVIRIITLI